MDKIFIGTSGYSYRGWKGKFYPDDLQKREWISFYSKKFNSVELNVTFYRLPRKKTFENWNKRTEENFKFVLKAPRKITHFGKLSVDDDYLREFSKRASGLGKKFSMVLWQLPPNLKMDIELLTGFLSKLEGISPLNKVKHSIEFRNHTWFDKKVFQKLSERNIALVCAHSAKFPFKEKHTADFAYFRFHGPEELYKSKYSNIQLEKWAERMSNFLQENDEIYVFFNNDYHGYAIENAEKLKQLLDSRT